MNIKPLSILIILFLTSCASKPEVVKGEIYKGGEIRYSVKKISEEDIENKNKIINNIEFSINKTDLKEKIRINNIGILKSEKEKWFTITKDFSRIKIPEYDVLNYKAKFEATDFENYIFNETSNIHKKIIDDALNISNEEIMYFIKNKKFIMPHNKYEFLAHYPCSDISEDMIGGYLTIKRDIEISAGSYSGEMVRNGVQKMIDNRNIKFILDKLIGVPKIDSGWYYQYSNCVDKNNKIIEVINKEKRK